MQWRPPPFRFTTPRERPATCTVRVEILADRVGKRIGGGRIPRFDDSVANAAMKKLKDNPGTTASGELRWDAGTSEKFDLVQLLAQALREQGVGVAANEGIVSTESGFELLPLVADVQLRESHVQSVTTIQVHHPLLFPDDYFEFQHSTGDDLRTSATEGFRSWARTDLVVLEDALVTPTKTCMAIELTLAAGCTRRAVLGPVAYFAERQPPQGPDDHAPFCSCCMLSKSFEAFEELFTRTGPSALRMFAQRDAHGTAAADARVNGLDFPPGKAALTAYARTWPDAGFEFRKQLVVVHDVKGTAVAVRTIDTPE
jgi:hypothetical protein